MRKKLFVAIPVVAILLLLCSMVRGIYSGSETVSANTVARACPRLMLADPVGGVRNVILNVADPDPIAGLTNPGSSYANDLEIKVIGGLPGSAIDGPRTKLMTPEGTDMGWTVVVHSGGKKATLTKPAGSGGMWPNGAGRALHLQSVNIGEGGGWDKVEYSTTMNTKTIYSMWMIPLAGQVTAFTENYFPAGLGWRLQILNDSEDEDLEGFSLSFDTAQDITELGSDEAGTATLGTKTYMFTTPLGPGDTAFIYWTYDGYSSTPENDTEVTITAIR